MRDLITPLIIATATVAFASSAQAASIDQTQIAPGATEVIDRFGVCHKVTNLNSVPVMVPHRSPFEWSVGSKAFLYEKRENIETVICPGTPTDHCFMWVSGLGPGLVNDNGGASARIGTTDMVWGPLPPSSEYGGSAIVGAGEYPYAYEYPDGTKGPFHSAVTGSFDGLALGAGTKLVIYAGVNYSGSIVAEYTGPVVVASQLTQDIPYFKDVWPTEDWSGEEPLFHQFTPSTRKLVPTAEINNWGNGSFKVTCQ